MIRDILFVPNGIDTTYEKENHVLTGYINNINTQYTQVLTEYGNSGAYNNVYEYGVQCTSPDINLVALKVDTLQTMGYKLRPQEHRNDFLK